MINLKYPLLSFRVSLSNPQKIFTDTKQTTSRIPRHTRPSGGLLCALSHTGCPIKKDASFAITPEDTSNNDPGRNGNELQLKHCNVRFLKEIRSRA
ncbi:hypothetical protein TNCV_231111 [Trichonephila clavipes]|nr:hypothetical protein TNCV_231111 [Trichonephila clavipes]